MPFPLGSFERIYSDICSAGCKAGFTVVPEFTLSLSTRKKRAKKRAKKVDVAWLAVRDGKPGNGEDWPEHRVVTVFEIEGFDVARKTIRYHNDAHQRARKTLKYGFPYCVVIYHHATHRPTYGDQLASVRPRLKRIREEARRGSIWFCDGKIPKCNWLSRTTKVASGLAEDWRAADHTSAQWQRLTRRVTRARIDRVLRSRKVEAGVKAYRSLQAQYRLPRFSQRRTFREEFSKYYGLNRRPPKVRHAVFAELSSDHRLHRGSLSFGYILRNLHQTCGSLEASFATKILASVNPRRPVIDAWVLDNTGLKLPPFGTSDRLRKTIHVYELLRQLSDRFLRSPVGRYLVRRFVARYGANGITKAKMLDFVLWQTRRKSKAS